MSGSGSDVEGKGGGTIARSGGGADQPWQGDACSLVEAFRRGERSPLEELEAVAKAAEASQLNAFSYVDFEAARLAAAAADVERPFGGVPVGIKELEEVAGWPFTEASVPLAGHVGQRTATMVERLRDVGGAVLAVQTTSSEFGGVNVTRTHLHGVTRNPWEPSRTPGGSSGGAGAAVAGGLLTIASGSDGGGSIRIPAGFCGLVGLKGTYGRIPNGPNMAYGNLTAVKGCLARSVRDTARWFDVTAGHDIHDPLSLPGTAGDWEAGLGSHLDEVRGLRVAIVEDWGGAILSPAMWDVLVEVADTLVGLAGLRRVDGVDTSLPNMGTAWSLSGMLGIWSALEGHWPECADQLTPEMRSGLRRLEERYSIAARAKMDRRRTALNEAMARIFSEVDLVITASNPDVAFGAEGPMPKVFGGVEGGVGNNGVLTFPANMQGCPAISIPAGTVDGLPVGLQVVSRHFTEPLLLDLALLLERERPWPLVAPGSPS